MSGFAEAHSELSARVRSGDCLSPCTATLGFRLGRGSLTLGQQTDLPTPDVSFFLDHPSDDLPTNLTKQADGSLIAVAKLADKEPMSARDGLFEGDGVRLRYTVPDRPLHNIAAVMGLEVIRYGDDGGKTYQRRESKINRLPIGGFVITGSGARVYCDYPSQAMPDEFAAIQDLFRLGQPHDDRLSDRGVRLLSGLAFRALKN